MHFLSASSMPPKSLHAICKDLTPLANPSGVFFQQVFFLCSFSFWSWAQLWWYLFGFHCSFRDVLCKHIIAALIEQFSNCSILNLVLHVTQKQAQELFLFWWTVWPACPTQATPANPVLHHATTRHLHRGRQLKFLLLLHVLPLFWFCQGYFAEYSQTTLWPLMADNIWEESGWEKKDKLLFSKIWKVHLSWVSVMIG